MKIIIKKGILIDPKLKIKSKLDILISENKIERISQSISHPKARVINAEKLFVIPGIIDMHVHTRVPGNEKAENFQSLEKAAISGGITSILAMPNTEPPTDENTIKNLISKAKKESVLNIFFSSSLTKKRAGQQNADFDKAISNGAIAFTDDGAWVKKRELMEKALYESKKYDIPILSHCQYLYGKKIGAINLGKISRLLKIPGISKQSEFKAIERDIALAKKTGGILHIQHISSYESLELIKKYGGKNITCETCPHYFWFTEDDLKSKNPNFKMNPPLRTEKDRKEIISAIRNSVIDVIATDHAPHFKKQKKDLLSSQFGVIGLETLISASITKLYWENRIPLETIVKTITYSPARILRLKNKGSLSPGYDADISIIDIDKEHKIKKFYSRSSNSPFVNMKMKGKNIITILNGKIVYENGKFYI